MGISSKHPPQNLPTLKGYCKKRSKICLSIRTLKKKKERGKTYREQSLYSEECIIDQAPKGLCYREHNVKKDRHDAREIEEARGFESRFFGEDPTEAKMR